MFTDMPSGDGGAPRSAVGRVRLSSRRRAASTGSLATQARFGAGDELRHELAVLGDEHGLTRCRPAVMVAWVCLALVERDRRHRILLVRATPRIPLYRQVEVLTGAAPPAERRREWPAHPSEVSEGWYYFSFPSFRSRSANSAFAVSSAALGSFSPVAASESSRPSTSTN